MPIFRQSNQKLIPIKEKKIKKEENIKNFVEKNIGEVFGLRFVRTEFPLNNLRIDTLAFDDETKSFVIFEYKKVKKFSIIDQGYAYLALLLNNKADFILEHNEKCNKNLKKKDVDWSQSRVIFIASSFTKYQQAAINFQDLPIELWEVRKYEDNLISFSQIKASEKSESIKTIAKNKDIERVSQEVKEYTLEDHFKPHWDKSRELFEDLSERVLELDNRIEINPVKSYIGFKISKRLVISVTVRASKLVVGLLRTQPKDLKDPENKANYLEKSYEYYNQHITEFNIKNKDDIDYAMLLVKQVYKKFFE